jgi:hypothetical protein
MYASMSAGAEAARVLKQGKAHSTGRMLLEPTDPAEVGVPVGWLACRVVGVDTHDSRLMLH